MLVSGAIAEKTSRLVDPGEPIDLRAPRRYASRGGHKLEAALDRFGIEVAGLRCLDVGASTGGFTDCLLQRGAREVVALDVGRGQLDGRLRGDLRVEVREGVNARHLEAEHVGEPVDLVTVDVSFISVALVAPALVPLFRPGARGVVLVKPQFEAGPEQVGRGGIVRDEDVHRAVLRKVTGALGREGLEVTALAPSPVRGREGNVEFLAAVAARPAPSPDGGSGARAVDDAAIAAAVAEAHRAPDREPGPETDRAPDREGGR